MTVTNPLSTTNSAPASRALRSLDKPAAEWSKIVVPGGTMRISIRGKSEAASPSSP